MSIQQSEQIEAMLREESRTNVQPNRFNRHAPYLVLSNYKGRFTNHGEFTDLEVASAVGIIVDTATSDEKTLIGEFDASAVQSHPEFVAWMEDERNVGVIRDYILK